MAEHEHTHENHHQMPEEERQHYEEVVVSFQEYAAYELAEVKRRKRAFGAIPPHLKQHLCASITSQRLPRHLDALKANQGFLFRMAQVTADSTPPNVLSSPVRPRKSWTSPTRNFSKIRSTLHQCVRDWAAEGAEERDRCYRPFLEALESCFPNARTTHPSVLVPGAGLGRLALEIASRGFVTQGNEFSYQMLFASQYLLNCCSSASPEIIYPWIHNPSNTVNLDDHYRPITLPDIDPSSILQDPNADFSMCAGEFVEVYKDQVEQWDAVVTCFFIDAAPNVLEYLDVIHRILKPGGKWINLGPLLYHWQSHAKAEEDDERYQESVELTYEELKYAINSIGFEMEMEKDQECYYTCNIKSMMKTVYMCKQFVATKR